MQRTSRAIGPGGVPISQLAAHRRLARDLHPGAWWLWALGMATAATRTTNPLLLGLIIAVVAFVVASRRSDAAWATGFGAYLVLGLVVVVMRVVFRMLFDGQSGEHVLFTLPEIPLPGGAAGVRIGGPVSLEGMLAAFYDGLRLATLLICLGSANVLANPKRLLKSLPSALYEVGAAVTVALSVAPQLVESGRRVIRARRLRGDIGRRTRWFRQVVVPVMTDALDRSLLLAAAMDSRGYGRTGGVAPVARRLTGVLVIAGMLGICIGTYGLLDATAPRTLGLPMLALGLLLAVAGFLASSSRTQRTRYRPDRWRGAEWGVAATGAMVALAMQLVSTVDPGGLDPSLQPLQWPELPLPATLVILAGALPAVIAPPPVRTGPTMDSPDLGRNPHSSAPAPAAPPRSTVVAP